MNIFVPECLAKVVNTSQLKRLKKKDSAQRATDKTPQRKLLTVVIGTRMAAHQNRKFIFSGSVSFFNRNNGTSYTTNSVVL